MSTEKNAAYFAELFDNGPFPREITVNGKAMTVHFRRLNAGENMKLQSGIKFKTDGQGKTEALVNVQEQIKRSHQLVYYSVVSEKGERVFTTPEKVADLDGNIFRALLAEAEAINKEEDDPGKSSSKTAS